MLKAGVDNLGVINEGLTCLGAKNDLGDSSRSQVADLFAASLLRASGLLQCLIRLRHVLLQGTVKAPEYLIAITNLSSVSDFFSSYSWFYIHLQYKLVFSTVWIESVPCLLQSYGE